MNPYFADTPTCISFSGGRSSAFMLRQAIDAHGGTLPDHVLVCFANTGKEMPETLDFVHQCGVEWGVNIHWLELGRYEQNGVHEKGRHKGKPRWVRETHVVNYQSASRNGEPFERLIKARNYLPNPTARFCTQELKINRIADYAKLHLGDEYTNFLGIRADEPHRVARLARRADGHARVAPMAAANITRDDVSAFWNKHPFDLDLPNNNGTTDWGNCDLCYLKGTAKRVSIMKLRPDLAEWWIKMESIIASDISTASFRTDVPRYSDLLSSAQENMGFDFIDETIPCYCGD